jgi:hypothetical protein
MLGIAARIQASDDFATAVGPVIAELRQTGLSLNRIVAELKERGISTMRGGLGPEPEQSNRKNRIGMAAKTQRTNP